MRRRESHAPTDSPRARKAAHRRLARITGLADDDLRLSKHRIIAREADWRAWLPLPSIEVMRRMQLPRPGKHTCQALTRRGTPCRALALANGRCRLHGGLSTGPRTAEGWARTRAGYQAWLERQRHGGA